MRRPRSLATAAALVVAAVFGTASAGHHGAHVVVAPGQPAPRVGPSYLYPDLSEAQHIIATDWFQYYRTTC